MTVSDGVLTNGSTRIQERRVPAWRRIGLKLKYAKDVAVIHDGHSPTRNQAMNETDYATAQEGQNRADGSVHKKRKLADLHSDPRKSSDKIGEAKSKKQVTFSPSTEESHRQLGTSETSKDLESTANPSMSGPPTSGTHPSSKSSYQKIHASLAYLNQHHASHESWKFNKSKEIWLLKNALSLDHIPSSHNLALSRYLSGLRGDQAKSRLRASAEETILDDRRTGFELPVSKIDVVEDSIRTLQSSSMDDPVVCQEVYEKAIDRYKRRIEQCLEAEDSERDIEDSKLRERLAKRKRAEVVLWSVGPLKEADAQSRNCELNKQDREKSLSFVPSEKAGHAPGVKQKRKLRISKVESVSSSGDESSDTSESTGNDSQRTPATLNSRTDLTSPSSTELTSSSDGDSPPELSGSDTNSSEDEGDESSDGSSSSDKEID